MRFKMNRIKNNKRVDIHPYKNKKIVDKLPKPVFYSPKKFNIPENITGKNVNILVIDSGCPNHKDIKLNGEHKNFTGNVNDSEDRTGHSTIISGFLSGKNKKSIVGIASNAKVHYAKVVDKKGIINYNSIITAVLWGVIKNVDIMILALGSQYDYNVLHDAIKKAHKAGIIIFAAAGNEINTEGGEVDYPASYPEVYSVGSLTRGKKTNDRIKKQIDFALKNELQYSTYLENKYAKVSGSSVSTVMTAGVAALLIEQLNITKDKDRPKKIYTELKKIIK